MKKSGTRLISFAIAAASLMLLNNVACKAQYSESYTTAVGVRVGGTSGVTLTHFYKPTVAVEGILGAFGNGYSLTGLIEKHMPAFNAEGLSLYYGGGAHLAVYNGRDIYASRFGREIDYHSHNDLGFGVNGVVGLEYQMPENIPIVFSLDLKPFVEIGSGGYVGFAPDPSIGVKFILGRR
jgi:hypothetical protein